MAEARVRKTHARTKTTGSGRGKASQTQSKQDKGWKRMGGRGKDGGTTRAKMAGTGQELENCVKHGKKQDEERTVATKTERSKMRIDGDRRSDAAGLRMAVDRDS